MDRGIMNYISRLKHRIKLSIIVLVYSQTMNSTAYANELGENTQTSTIKTNMVDLYHTAQKRPVKVDLWYKESECSGKACDHSPIKQLNIAILSHGAMGSSKDYSWLAYPLAAQGWVVVGLNHFGESWRYGKQNIDPSSVRRLWQRTEDTSFVIDSLATFLPKHLSTVNANIVVIGHSSGGYTAAALAGVTLDVKQMQDYCRSAAAKGDLGCSYGEHERRKHTQPVAEKIVSGFDSRVNSIIMLDPAMGPAATEISLNKVTVPTLIIGSQQNDFLPFIHHAKHYAHHIPQAKLIVLNSGEGHFVYINSCDNNYQARGVALCQDRAGVNRSQVHQKLVADILKFVAKR